MKPCVTRLFAGTSSLGGEGDLGLVRYNTNGSLDTTFAGDGIRLDEIGDAIASARGAAVQADGKIIVAGDFAIARFNVDGTFDTSFGDGDGKIKSVRNIRAVAVQTDGKIVVAGSGGDSFVVARHNIDGSPDASFGSNGSAIALIGMGINSAVATAVAIQTDGAIVAAGYAVVNGNIDFAAARFFSNGLPDSSFDIDGKVTTPIGAGQDKGNALSIQPDGRILVAGSVEIAPGTSDFGIVRYNPDGSLDTSFSFDGKQTTPIGAGNDVGNAIAIQSGKILVAGSSFNGSNNDFALARYNADGSPDTSFDGDGKLTTPVGTLQDVGNALALQPNGKFLVAGSSETAASINDFAVVRYNADGSLDGTYSGDGKVLVDVSGANDLGHAIALDSSGRAVIAGQANGLFGVARLLGDGTGPTVASAVSRKMHGTSGTFDLNLPLTGTPGLECRSGASYQVVVTFAGAVALDGFTMSGGATPTGFSVNGSEVTLNFSPSSAGGKRLVLTLQNVTVGGASGNVVVSMNLLVGDTNGNGSVTASDIGQVKSQSGQAVTASNFRADVTARGGTINASDIGQVKAASGATLP